VEGTHECLELRGNINRGYANQRSKEWKAGRNAERKTRKHRALVRRKHIKRPNIKGNSHHETAHEAQQESTQQPPNQKSRNQPIEISKLQAQQDKIRKPKIW
jgi:hypothetical protein